MSLLDIATYSGVVISIVGLIIGAKKYNTRRQKLIVRNGTGIQAGNNINIGTFNESKNNSKR